VKKALILLLLAGLISSASANSWTYGIDNVTDGSSWWIHRESGTIGFDMSSSFEGQISPIEGPGGRVLDPYHSHYVNVNVNDVRLKEVTGTLAGTYSAEDEIKIRAEAEADVNRTYFKPSGDDIWYVTLEENWPVCLNASRSIDYAGLVINDRECVGNNGDAVTTNFLYNNEYSKERKTSLKLDRLNATIVATDDTILWADVLPTKSLDYEIESHSTGIADLKYKQVDPNTQVVNYGAERYHGIYDITRKIKMESVYINETIEKDWLSCCVGGCSDVDLDYVGVWNGAEVFGCVCS